MVSVANLQKSSSMIVVYTIFVLIGFLYESYIEISMKCVFSLFRILQFSHSLNKGRYLSTEGQYFLLVLTLHAFNFIRRMVI